MPEAFQLRWDGRIGPAFIAAVASILTTVAIGGMIWGRTAATLENAVEAINKADRERVKIRADMSEMDNRLYKVETQLTFVVPSLSRIEGKLNDISTAKK